MSIPPVSTNSFKDQQDSTTSSVTGPCAIGCLDSPDRQPGGERELADEGRQEDSRLQYRMERPRTARKTRRRQSQGGNTPRRCVPAAQAPSGQRFSGRPLRSSSASGRSLTHRLLRTAVAQRAIGVRCIRLDEPRRETEPGSRLRHRHYSESRRKQLLP